MNLNNLNGYGVVIMAKCPDCNAEMEPKGAGEHYCHRCQTQWWR